MLLFFMHFLLACLLLLFCGFVCQRIRNLSAPHLIIDKLSTGFKKETEDGLNKVLQCGDLENIEKHVTPQNLTNCTTNCIEKSFKVRLF